MNKTQKQFPKALTREDHFKSPIWFADAPEFVNELNKASDSYIQKAQKEMKKNME